MVLEKSEKIAENSRTPKYLQVVNLILEEIEKGSILIEPFRKECLGTNSYDVHLGKHLGCYKDRVLDAKAHNKIDLFENVSVFMKFSLVNPSEL